jgi:predicted aconitase
MGTAMRLHLDAEERRMLAGDAGQATAMAMGLIVALAEINGADRLVEVRTAHVDSCLYHGTVGLDFAERLAHAGGRVRVPTTLNVSSLDLLHPELVRLDQETTARARRQMDAYVAMGCTPTWTCAPYQLPTRPAAGEHVAWAESNAIVFANSVLGARTGRYGDFIDICAALTGRVPLAGLHRPEERLARLVFEVAPLPAEAYQHDELYALLGHIVGQLAGSRVPALTGLPQSVTEDQLKALGAAAASSGAVAMFHMVGVTPEAPELSVALGGRQPEQFHRLTPASLRAAWTELSTAPADGRLKAVSLGTPHFSMAEFERLTPMLRDVEVAPGVTLYVSTGRQTVSELERRGWLETYRRPGLQLVTDTCTYITPIIDGPGGVVMTNAAKLAWYAPGNLGVTVAFGTLEDCVRSAVEGRVTREPLTWLDG